MTVTVDWKNDWTKRIRIEDLPPRVAMELMARELETHARRVHAATLGIAAARGMFESGAQDAGEALVRSLSWGVDLDFTPSIRYQDRACQLLEDELAREAEGERVELWALELARKSGWIPEAPMPDEPEPVEGVAPPSAVDQEPF